MRREGISGLRWSWVVLALLCIAAIVVAVIVVGPTSFSQASRSRTVTAEKGVVQSTVSGSGSLQVQETDVNFADSGQLTEVNVKAGDHVVEGQVLAKIKSNDQKLALDQAEANLTSAAGEADAGGGPGVGVDFDHHPDERRASRRRARPPPARRVPTGQPGQPGAATRTRTRNSAARTRSSQNQTNTAATQASNRRTSHPRRRVWTALRRPSTAPSRPSGRHQLTAPVSGTVASVSAGVGDFVSGGGSSGQGRATPHPIGLEQRSGGGGIGGGGGNGCASN